MSGYDPNQKKKEKEDAFWSGARGGESYKHTTEYFLGSQIKGEYTPPAMPEPRGGRGTAGGTVALLIYVFVCVPLSLMFLFEGSFGPSFILMLGGAVCTPFLGYLLDYLIRD